MALPLSNAAENEDELVQEFSTDGYAQLPIDHLSDSSESSHDTAWDPSIDTLAISLTVPRTEHLATTHNTGAVTHIPHAIPCYNDGHVPYNGPEVQAAISFEGAVSHIRDHNGGHGALIDDMNTRGATDDRSLYQSAGHGTGLETEGTIGNEKLDDTGGRVVHLNGMEIHMFGQFAGLQLSSPPRRSYLGNNDGDEEFRDDEEIVDERERQRAEDAAFQKAKEADDARRSAPLPQDRCQAIKTAMQNISLGGFRPEWADSVPEDQWINRLREKVNFGKLIRND